MERDDLTAFGAQGAGNLQRALADPMFQRQADNDLAIHGTYSSSEDKDDLGAGHATGANIGKGT